MKISYIAGCVAGVLALALSGPAFAQEDPFDPEEPIEEEEEEDPFEEEEEPLDEPDPMEEDPMDEEEVEPAPPVEPEIEDPEEPTPGERAQEVMEEIGVGVSVGGGVLGFTQSEARDLADVGGSWDGRVSVGTRFPIGVEAAYVGSAQDIDALGLDEDAILVGNGLEGAARVNIPIIEEFTPYALAGLGWTRYSLANEDFNTSNVQDSDNVGYVPLGAGLTYRVGRAAFDLRGKFSPAFNDDLVQAEDGQPEADLDTWGVTGRVGFEF